MKQKFVIIRNVQDGIVYLDNNPSKMAPVGIELAYFDSVKDAMDRYPTVKNVTTAPVAPAPAAKTQDKE